MQAATQITAPTVLFGANLANAMAAREEIRHDEPDSDAPSKAVRLFFVAFLPWRLQPARRAVRCRSRAQPS